MMKSISFWAKENPRKAQISIVLLYVCLNLLAICFGFIFRESGILFSELLMDISFFIFVSAVLLYKKKANYYYRKSLDFILISTTFLMLGFWANRAEERTFYTPFSFHTATGITTKPVVNEEPNHKSIAGEKTASKKEWRKAEKAKAKKERREIATWLKVLLILLVVASAIFLSYLVAILSCNISCSGAEGLAIVVLVLGLTGAIGGGVVLIRRILGYRNRRRMMEEPSPSSDDY